VDILLELADGLTGLRGEAAYAALVQQFAAIVAAREVFLTECCNYPATRVRMLAHWYMGQFAPSEEFDLSGTPCEEVILGGEPLFVSHGASERWPAELEWGTQAYLGLPCIDSKGVVIGHIACKHGEAIDREWQSWSLTGQDRRIAEQYCRDVKIAVTGGFTAAKIRQFEDLGVPADLYGVGSWLLSSCDDHGTSNDFTADVVRVKIDGRWVDMAKTGRRWCDNLMLERVE